MENLLNAIGSFASKILLSDLTMWLLFWLLGYLLLPADWGDWLTTKTPENFLSFFSLRDIAILVFSFFSTLIFKYLKILISKIKLQNKELTSKKIRKIYENNLNDFDRLMLAIIAVDKLNMDAIEKIEVKISISNLKNYGLIEESFYSYYAKSQVKSFILTEIAKSPNLQKLLSSL